MKTSVTALRQAGAKCADFLVTALMLLIINIVVVVPAATAIKEIFS